MPRMYACATIFGAVLAAAVCLTAEQAPVGSPQGDELTFEVASIKPLLEVGASQVQVLPNQFTATNIPVQRLLIYAYGVPAARILNAPSWVNSDRFEVRAKPPRPSTQAEIYTMLRALLVKRFALKARVESRIMDVYALVVARPDRQLGPKLQSVSVRKQPPPQTG